MAPNKELYAGKARDVWAVQQDVTKMTNKQLIAILRPLRKKDEPAIPSRKDLLLARYVEWADRVTLEMLTPQMPQATPPPTELTTPTNGASSTPSETPAPDNASSPPTDTPSPNIASPPLGSTHSNTASTSSPPTETPSPDIASPPLGATPPPDSASSPPTETRSPNITYPPLGSTRRNTTSTFSPPTETPSPNIASPPLSVACRSAAGDNAYSSPTEPPSRECASFCYRNNNYGSDEDEMYDFWNDESMMLLQLGLNKNVPESKRAEAIEAMMALGGQPESV